MIIRYELGKAMAIIINASKTDMITTILANRIGTIGVHTFISCVGS